MTAISVKCSHQDSLIPLEKGEELSVEYVKGMVCPDAVVGKVDYTAVRRYKTKVADHLYHLYVSSEDFRGDVEYLLTMDGVIIDRLTDSLSNVDDFWGGVTAQIAEAELNYSFMEVLNRALELSDEG